MVAEIKRASPSKGDIAPDIIAGEQVTSLPVSQFPLGQSALPDCHASSLHAGTEVCQGGGRWHLSAYRAYMVQGILN